MECMLVIDRREKGIANERLLSELAERQKWQPGQLGAATLELFDIIFEQNGVRRAAFERKQAKDVVDSCRDGRFEEQLARIVQYATEHPEVVVGYIVEGSLMNLEYGQFNEAHIRHLLWNLSKYGITVVTTVSLDQTCEYLLYMRYTMGKELSIEQARANAELNRDLYRGKKRQLEEKDVVFQLLRLISVPAVKAQAIAARYKSLATLINALEINEDALLGFKTPGSTKIGKAMSQKIFRMLIKPS